MTKNVPYEITSIRVYGIFIFVGLLSGILEIMSTISWRRYEMDLPHTPFTGILELDVILTIFATILMFVYLFLIPISTFYCIIGKLPREYSLPPLFEVLTRILMLFMWNNSYLDATVRLLGSNLGLIDVYMIVSKLASMIMLLAFLKGLISLYKAQRLDK